MAEKQQQVQYYSAKLRRFAIEQLAAGETLDETQTLIFKQFSIKVPVPTINTWRYRKRDQILTRRKELNDELAQLPIANIYYRLRVRQNMIDEIKKKGLFYLNQFGVEKSRCLEINRILDSVAEELKPIINVNIDTEINAIINASVEEFEEFLIKE